MQPVLQGFFTYKLLLGGGESILLVSPPLKDALNPIETDDIFRFTQKFGFMS